MNRMSLTTLTAIVSLLCTSTFAQVAPTRERIDSLYAAAQTHIDGKKHPQLVPYYVRMDILFTHMHGYLGTQLKERISGEDFRVLEEHAASMQRFKAAARANQRDPLDDPAMKIAARGANKTGIELAQEIKAATEQIHARKEAEYRAVLSKLSVAGRAAVESFAFEMIRPQVSVEDPTVIANGEPDWYKVQIMGLYELIRSGKYKPGQTPPARVQSSGGSDDARLGGP